MSKTSLSCGIVGLPNVGKSTLYNALTRNRADAANFPFCTIDPNVGIVNVPDSRLPRLSELSHSKRVLPSTVTFVDIAGLVKGAAQGEGLGNKFLSNIRETDLIIHVVRCFENEEVVHVEGRIDPLHDIEIINLELILADIQMAENIKGKLEKQVKGNKEYLPVISALDKTLHCLNENKSLRRASFTEEEEKHLSLYNFLTKKQVIYLTNVSEENLPLMENEYTRKVKEYAKTEGSRTVPVCAKLESELSQLSDEEAKEFLDSLEIPQTGLNLLIKESFDALGLISFITTGEMETRAWTIRRGDTAAVAGGKIHSDIEKGFIRAEVVSFEDMMACGSRVSAREAGKARSEGKNYVVQDGDVILFFHN